MVGPSNAPDDWTELLPLPEIEVEVTEQPAATPAPAPALVPVAVSERLSREEDCDEQGRCWWFSPPACGHHKIRPCWTLDSEVMEGDTHWCPYSALPSSSVSTELENSND
jgi:hypothetical protein